jgi:predicted ferric reductase
MPAIELFGVGQAVLIPRKSAISAKVGFFSGIYSCRVRASISFRHRASCGLPARSSVRLMIERPIEFYPRHSGHRATICPITITNKNKDMTPFPFSFRLGEEQT